MFEFFLALFGGLFYSGKLSSDKSKVEKQKKSATQRIEQDADIGKRIVVTNEAKESVINRLTCGDYTEDIYEELRENLEFVFETSDVKKSFLVPTVKIRPDAILRDTSNVYWAYHLLLSHIGKVDWITYSFGFQLGGEQTVNRDIRFCQRIEYNLSKCNGGYDDLKLFLNPKYSTYTNDYDWKPCAKTMVFEHQLVRKELGKRLW